MPRPSRTKIRGLHRHGNGRLIIKFRYRHPVTRELATYFERLPAGVSREAAVRRCLLIRDRLLSGQALPIQDRTMADALDAYLGEMRGRNAERTIERKAGMAERFKEEWGTQAISSLTPDRLSLYFRMRLEEGVTGATCNREMATLKHFFRMAARRKWVSREVMLDVCELERFKEDRPPSRYYTLEQVKAILGHQNVRVTRMVRFALLTGLRQGSLIALDWENVDLPHRMARVQAKGRELVTVALNRQAVALLRSMRPKPPIGPVFRTRRGRRFTRSGLASAFRRVREKVGITGRCFHTLRHTVGTLLAVKGATAWQIRQVLHHSDIATSQRYVDGAAQDVHAVVRLLTVPDAAAVAGRRRRR